MRIFGAVLCVWAGIAIEVGLLHHDVGFGLLGLTLCAVGGALVGYDNGRR